MLTGVRIIQNTSPFLLEKPPGFALRIFKLAQLDWDKRSMSQGRDARVPIKPVDISVVFGICRSLDLRDMNISILVSGLLILPIPTKYYQTAHHNQRLTVKYQAGPASVW